MQMTLYGMEINRDHPGRTRKVVYSDLTLASGGDTEAVGGSRKPEASGAVIAGCGHGAVGSQPAAGPPWHWLVPCI